MKFSQFNCVIPFHNQYAIFNSFSQKVIFVEPKLHALLMASMADCTDGLKAVHPSFYDYLVDQGFVVEESKDEVALVRQKVEEIDNQRSAFFLMINPNMTCNFKCYYCYETHVNKSRISAQTIDSIRKFISKEVKVVRSFPLSFFGGEPLLYFHKDVAPIVDWYAAECRSAGLTPIISFTTNGFLADQDFIDFFRGRNLPCSFQITFDGFGEEHDRVRFHTGHRGSYRTIVSNVQALVQNGFFVRVRINYTDKNISDAHLVARDLRASINAEIQRQVLFDFHRVWQNYEAGDISGVLKECIEKVRSYGFEVSNTYSMNNVAESCYADKVNSAVINYNGDIFKCTARDFQHGKREGFLSEDGELIWENGNLEKRMDAKFKNRPCLKCRIMPLCNGGCSQHAIENSGSDYCIFNGDESEKDKVVESKISEIVQAMKEQKAPLAAAH